MEEQRRSPRRGAQAAVVLDDGHAFHAGTVRDLSERGLYVETSAPLSVGALVSLSPLDREGLEVRGRVTHARDPDRPGGLGIELLGSPSENERFLAAVVGVGARPRRPTIPPGRSGNS